MPQGAVAHLGEHQGGKHAREAPCGVHAAGDGGQLPRVAIAHIHDDLGHAAPQADDANSGRLQICTRSQSTLEVSQQIWKSF